MSAGRSSRAEISTSTMAYSNSKTLCKTRLQANSCSSHPSHCPTNQNEKDKNHRCASFLNAAISDILQNQFLFFIHKVCMRVRI